MKLLLTVSGGLEDLAERQVQLAFNEALQELSWHRKPSGSQLYVTLHLPDAGDDVSFLVDAIGRLDYVEYVYALLGSVRYQGAGDDDLLSWIQKAASCMISQASLEYCRRLSDVISKLYPVDVGLEGLPGKLLPTPDVAIDPASQMVADASQTFDVNTIYTKPAVAEAIIRTITEFCEHNFDSSGSEQSLWLDAGSGNGSLLRHMPQGHSIGVDTHPASPDVLRLDFLEVTKSWLERRFPLHERLFVVSNPPFSTSSRGDYAPIVRFVNHSFEVLGADVVAVICPCKFARRRIWQSLGMTEEAVLLGRFFLPKDAFYSPSTGEEVHIHSYCLIFGRACNRSKVTNDEPAATMSENDVYLSSQRDKGYFPDLLKTELSKVIATGLSEAGVALASERDARYTINAKLASSLELWWHVNPQRPCSLVNSNCVKVPHSLGWMSLSAKPPVALAMASMALKKEKSDGSDSSLAVNLMSGESTIELEASRATEHSFFMLSGDKSRDNAFRTAERLQKLNSGTGCHSLVDVVVWDAQRLPLRKGIADALFADLPFQGSVKNTHQEPKVGRLKRPRSATTNSALSYAKILEEANRILRPKGRAVLLSVDTKALRHASGQFNWSPVGYNMKINTGGLPAQIFLMERREACTKDLSMWVPPSTTDLSSNILGIAGRAIEVGDDERSPIESIALHSTFVHDEKGLSHCYRIRFDGMVRNVDAKQMEQRIRKAIENEAMNNVVLR